MVVDEWTRGVRRLLAHGVAAFPGADPVGTPYDASVEHVADLDQVERDARSTAAATLLEPLREQGVVAVATTFVDTSGVSRVKCVPLERLPHLAAWGVGSSVAFDRFRFDDWIAGAGEGREAVGDLRVMPDVRRVVPLSAQPGWAWAPADRYAQDGSPHPQCSRLTLSSQVSALAALGLRLRTSFEIEWVVGRQAADDSDDDFRPAVRGPAYGMARLVDGSDYVRDVLVALADSGVVVEQFHPEYAPGQLELSVAAEDAVSAADTSVLVRTVISGVGARHGFRTSFSPKVAVPGVGNGGHVHLSLWRDEVNLMAGGDGPYGLTAEGEAFTAGILHHLPALMAVGAPGAASYLRHLPSHWAGTYACWGLENREAALRMVTGPAGSESKAANVEVKCFDLHANPYLVLAGLIASALAGLRTAPRLPEPVDVDPAVLPGPELAERGIRRLPQSLREAAHAFRADDVLSAAYGPDLAASVLALRESEIELFEGATDEEIAAATRWQR
jgi:glutamine synthetase